MMNYLYMVLVNFDSPTIYVYSNRSFVLKLLLMDLLDPMIVLEINCHYLIVDYVLILHLLFVMANHVLHRVIDYLYNDYFVIYECYVVDDYLLNYIDFVQDYFHHHHHDDCYYYQQVVVHANYRVYERQKIREFLVNRKLLGRIVFSIITKIISV